MKIIVFETAKKMHECKYMDPTFWVFERLTWPVHYYVEVLDLFDFVITERSVSGYMFVCRDCGCPAAVREDEAELHRVMLVTMVRCAGCGRSWRLRGSKPIWETILEDWDLDAYPCDWRWWRRPCGIS